MNEQRIETNKPYNMNKITILGITILIIYSVIKILKFYLSSNVIVFCVKVVI